MEKIEVEMNIDQKSIFNILEQRFLISIQLFRIISRSYRNDYLDGFEKKEECDETNFWEWIEESDKRYKIVEDLLDILRFIEAEKYLYFTLKNRLLKISTDYCKNEINIFIDNLINKKDEVGIKNKLSLTSDFPLWGNKKKDNSERIEFLESKRTLISECRDWHQSHLNELIYDLPHCIGDNQNKQISKRINGYLKYDPIVLFNYYFYQPRNNKKKIMVNIETKAKVALTLLESISSLNLINDILKDIYSDDFGNLELKIIEFKTRIENKLSTVLDYREKHGTTPMDPYASGTIERHNEQLLNHVNVFEIFYTRGDLHKYFIQSKEKLEQNFVEEKDESRKNKLSSIIQEISVYLSIGSNGLSMYNSVDEIINKLNT